MHVCRFVPKNDLDKVKKTVEELADVGDEAEEGDASFPMEMIRALESAFKKACPFFFFFFLLRISFSHLNLSP